MTVLYPPSDVEYHIVSASDHVHAEPVTDGYRQRPTFDNEGNPVLKSITSLDCPACEPLLRRMGWTVTPPKPPEVAEPATAPSAYPSHLTPTNTLIAGTGNRPNVIPLGGRMPGAQP